MVLKRALDFPVMTGFASREKTLSQRIEEGEIKLENTWTFLGLKYLGLEGEYVKVEDRPEFISRRGEVFQLPSGAYIAFAHNYQFATTCGGGSSSKEFTYYPVSSRKRSTLKAMADLLDWCFEIVRTDEGPRYKISGSLTTTHKAPPGGFSNVERMAQVRNLLIETGDAK